MAQSANVTRRETCRNGTLYRTLDSPNEANLARIDFQCGYAVVIPDVRFTVCHFGRRPPAPADVDRPVHNQSKAADNRSRSSRMLRTPNARKSMARQVDALIAATL